MKISERIYKGVYLQAKTPSLLLWEALAPAHSQCWHCRKETRSLSVARDCNSSVKMCGDCVWDYLISIAQA